MSIDDRKHKGLLKVGEVFVNNDVADTGDKQVYTDAVREILDKRSYMHGVGSYLLEYVECTTYEQNTKCYKADDVYRTLNTMDIHFTFLNKIKRADVDIWYACSVDDVKEAISRIKNGQGAGYGSIHFRPEQEDAINDTVDYFQKEFKDEKKGKHFLWNAKMRFGKTLCGLEVAKRMNYKSTLIITHRPVVDKGWHEDFEKIFVNDDKIKEKFGEGFYTYATRMSDDDAEGGDFYHLTKSVDNGSKRLVFFVSMQYLRLSQYVGGKERNFDPLKRAIMTYDWDLVMVDEAHEGIDAAAGIRVMDKLRKEKTRILSLSGTPFNLLEKYDEKEIYTWDYVMEQKAKQEWDDEHYGDPNPYADLPRMQILTFTLPKMLREEAIQNNEAFKFHEFFRVWKEEDKTKLQAQIDEEKSPLKKVQLQADFNEIHVGKFVHEGAVKKFIKKLVEQSPTSQYPFSTPEFLDKFSHTFWLVPGVPEAKALEELLLKDDVFGKEAGFFKIINAAGDGNIEDINGDALAEVQHNIEGFHGYYKNKFIDVPQAPRTITLSCGKLTTGVSVPEWTAVLCMKGSENTPAANYMQTIFRVQTHAVLNGRQKSDCYVFDFAPDRALTAVAETSKMAVYAQTERGKGQLKLSQQKEEEHLESFIKLCPVLSMDEGEMGRNFTANQIFEKLSNVYIERAVRSGYSDNSLYNPDQLMNLTPEQEKALGDVHDLLGSMPSGWKPDPITLNHNGIGNTKDVDQIKYIYYLSAQNIVPMRPTMAEEKDEDGRPTTNNDEWSDVMTLPTPLFKYLYVSSCRLKDGEWSGFSNPVLWKEYTEPNRDDDDAKKQREQENKEKRARMSVLRGVSIRIPLLVYGAEINDEAGEEITIDNFASEEIVDQASWEEFMPKGFTKETFNILKDCFDRSIFTGAAKRIRAMVKEADNLSTEDRIDKIATIFSYFHNPDKETVLTPWRVVNLQLSDTLGGWCFYNEQFDDINTVENEYQENIKFPRFVDRGDVTKNVFSDYNSRILEINSKTGLYPLYMAYSLFKEAKEPAYRGIKLTGERGKNKDASQYNKQAGDDLEIWKDVLQDNIFVVCRTKMAVSITKRTLAGFRKNISMNIKCYEHDVSVNDLISANVFKKEDEGISKVDKTYFYNEQDFFKCDMTNVLIAKPEYFEHDVVRGKDFWHVYNAIPKAIKEDINNMKFKAIVGNPPYQINKATDKAGANSSFATAIYPMFIEISRKISPDYISLITPSRWMTKTGQGVSEDWVDDMINCNHIMTIHDFTNATDCFTGVEIKGGVSYFLYSEAYKGLCHQVSHTDNCINESDDFLNAFDAGIVIRDIRAKRILKAIMDVHGDYFGSSSFAEHVGPQHFFDKDGLLTTSWKDYSIFPDEEHNIKYYLNKQLESSGVAWIDLASVPKNTNVISMHKVFFPKAGGSGNDPIVLGRPFYGEPGSVCSQTYLVVGYNGEITDSKMAHNIIAYMKSRFLRYIVSIKKKTQDNPSSVFVFVPNQDFSSKSDINWNVPQEEIDTQLYRKYKLSTEDIHYIESMIKPME
jgi:hypothetical protein